jgi:hypothetical protein
MNRKCYTCEHIKTYLFRLCIQMMGYEVSHKQNKLNTVCTFSVQLFYYVIFTKNQRQLVWKYFFRQFCVTITINSNV